MRSILLPVAVLLTLGPACDAVEPPARPVVLGDPNEFKTLVNPACSHCRDEAKRRAADLKTDDRVLTWTRGYSEGGAIPIRFFLNPYRVISDSYGVFVYDPDAGYARGFSPSYEFRFQGWRNGVMVMKHKDGTQYSCLSGIAFDGPKKGTRLKPIPTISSEWGWWTEKYPNAVAYHMFDKYQPVELPTDPNPGSLRSRVNPDPRLEPQEEVLGLWTTDGTRAYPTRNLEHERILTDKIGSQNVVILFEPKTRSAAAYRPLASAPRQFKPPQPDVSGTSVPDDGILLTAEAAQVKARPITLGLAPADSPGRFRDVETKSFWDVTGRCVDGSLKGFTLEWVDSVQAKWFAWSAEYPDSTLYDNKR